MLDKIPIYIKVLIFICIILTLIYLYRTFIMYEPYRNLISDEILKGNLSKSYLYEDYP